MFFEIQLKPIGIKVSANNLLTLLHHQTPNQLFFKNIIKISITPMLTN
ncbi:hypothetical protein MNBD_GAMMA17-2038 [hydrothermal vent metagenome]|uniref:Uncharacterized protein n=1 Tax=hydrothermal vent metagenome TaxID=652676 RepID=A0A3B0ZRG7_9ZZZZ